MAFKSQAQRAKFGEMVASGKMSQAEFDKWNSETPANIPQKVAPKPNATKVPKVPKTPPGHISSQGVIKPPKPTRPMPSAKPIKGVAIKIAPIKTVQDIRDVAKKKFP